MAEHTAIGGENLAFAHKAHIAAVVHHGQIPCAGIVEDLHHTVHAHGGVDAGGRDGHEFAHIHLAIQVGAEHYVAYLVEHHHAFEHAVGIDHRKEIAAAFGYGVDHILERHLGAHGEEIGLDHVVDLQQGEHGFVLVVGDELSALGQTHGVDAVWLENLDGAVGYGTDYEQRQKEVVAAGELGGEEDGHQWRVHDAAHDTRHAYEGEVFGAEHGVEAHHIGHESEEKARHAAHIKGGREGAAHTTGAIGGGGGESLGEYNDGDEQDQKPCLAALGVEDGAVEYGRRVAVEQARDGAVAFAVERRQKKHQRR